MSEIIEETGHSGYWWVITILIGECLLILGMHPIVVVVTVIYIGLTCNPDVEIKGVVFNG